MKHRAKGYLLPVWLLIFILILIQCSMFRDIDEQELAREIFDLVNEHRASLGMLELTWNETVAAQCREHCENMASGSVPFGHDGFEERTENIRLNVSILSIRENVGYLADAIGMTNPATYIFDLWLDNPAHRESIEGVFNQTGVGVWTNGIEFYFTQIFIHVRENSRPE